MAGMWVFDDKSFIVKHWALSHPDRETPLEMKFYVRRSFQDQLTMLITEAAMIDKYVVMNSKSQWGHIKLSRLCLLKN